MASANTETDETRLNALRDWTARQIAADIQGWRPASSDASFRRYFRVQAGGHSYVVMDAPPGQEDCRPFVHVAHLLQQAGVHVPEILAQDFAQGFLLLGDLGEQTYLQVLDGNNADRLFGDAIDALIRWQLATREGVLPEYDRALLHRELRLFADWYVARHLRLDLSTAQREVLESTFVQLERDALAQPRVYVHRDYMPRNLMVSTPNPGVLDFQDAVHGPIAYDVLSLFKDAFISWDERRILDWLRCYRERAERAGLPVPRDFADFRRACDWIGLQRHLKVIGIFARICHRDGKPRYLEDIPRFLGYIRAAARRYPEFSPLLRLLDSLDEQAPGSPAS